MDTSAALRIALIVGALFLAQGLSLAQPVINEKALPKGMTKADATAIITALHKSNTETLAKAEADYKSALDAGSASLAAVQKKTQELAKSNTEYKAFLGTQKAISSSKAPNRAARLTAHYEKSKALLDKVYLLAGGSGAKDSESVLVFLRKVSPTVSRAGEKLLGYVDRIKPPAPRPGPPITMTFSPPFAISTAGTREHGEEGITEATATVSPTTSAFALHAVAYQGDCRCSAFATTAVFVDVPAGKTRMSVRVPYQYSYTLHADAGQVQGARAGYLSLVHIEELSTNFTIMAQPEPPPSEEANVSAYMTSVDLQDSGSAIYENVANCLIVAGRRYIISINAGANVTSVPTGFVNADVSLAPTSFEIVLN